MVVPTYRHYCFISCCATMSQYQFNRLADAKYRFRFTKFINKIKIFSFRRAKGKCTLWNYRWPRNLVTMSLLCPLSTQMQCILWLPGRRNTIFFNTVATAARCWKITLTAIRFVIDVANELQHRKMLCAWRKRQ